MNKGTLYMVPTPIGNLKDITLRALDVLKEVDIIAAEDTRQTLKLLNHFDIKKTLISYHKHNEQSKGNEIINMLNEGNNIAVVTDAGTPGISDPGEIVCRKCIEEGINIEVLPGATAFTTALIYSGLDTSRFLFRGFIPRETKGKKILLDEIKDVRDTIIFYESPHRVLSTLSVLRESLGNRRVAVCKELTKLYENIFRGTLDEAIENFKDKNLKGEFVIVVEGKTDEEIKKENNSKWENISIEEHIVMLINEGLTKKEAIKKVAKDRGIPKNEVYKYSVNL